MKDLIARFFMFLASMFTAKQLGKTEARKEHAEKIAEERNEDANIASEPFVDDPVNLMCGNSD